MSKSRSRKRRFSFTGFLKLTRFPNLLIIGFTQYFSTIFLVGYPEHWFDKLYDFNLFLLSSSTILIAAAGYIINDYYDIKIDYVNKPDKVVVGKLVNRRIVLVSHGVLNFIGIAIGFYLSLFVFLSDLRKMALQDRVVLCVGSDIALSLYLAYMAQMLSLAW